MFDSRFLEDFLLSSYLYAESGVSIWVGQLDSVRVRLLNKDGSTPYLRQIDADNDLLVLAESLTVATQFYRVTLVSDADPSSNGNYWISYDDGATMEQIKLIQKQRRSVSSYWRIIFQKQ